MLNYALISKGSADYVFRVLGQIAAPVTSIWTPQGGSYVTAH
jgi:hypothetical protein